MNSFTKTSLLLFFCVLFMESSMAYEEVRLITTEKTELNAIKSRAYILEEANKKNKIILLDEEYDFLEPEKEIFKNKTGKAFSRFINEKAIDNKLNRFIDTVENHFLEEY